MTEPAHELWLRRARSNLDIAKSGKRARVMFEDLCFEAQQAAEKALKALLLYLTGDYPRTHAFALLLSRLSQQVSVPPPIREVVELTDYAVQVRYPGDYTPVSVEEYRRAIVLAERVLVWVGDEISARDSGAQPADA
jgi:HEPN domain-containing protein